MSRMLPHLILRQPCEVGTRHYPLLLSWRAQDRKQPAQSPRGAGGRALSPVAGLSHACSHLCYMPPLQLRRMRNDCRDLPRDDSVIFSTADDVFYACSNHSLRTAYSLFIKNTSQILVLSSSCLGDGSFYPHVTQEMENARSPTALDCQSTLPLNTLCKWNTVTRNWPPSILDSGCHTCVSGF